MTLGLTDGTSNAGIVTNLDWNGKDPGGNALKPSNPDYGKSVGSASKMPSYSRWGDGKTIGVTTDPTKSGIIATFSGLTLGTVASEKLGNFYIHY